MYKKRLFLFHACLYSHSYRRSHKINRYLHIMHSSNMLLHLIHKPRWVSRSYFKCLCLMQRKTSSHGHTFEAIKYCKQKKLAPPNFDLFLIFLNFLRPMGNSWSNLYTCLLCYISSIVLLTVNGNFAKMLKNSTILLCPRLSENYFVCSLNLQYWFEYLGIALYLSKQNSLS